jgi:cytochrome c oxidase subunit II
VAATLTLTLAACNHADRHVNRPAMGPGAMNPGAYPTGMGNGSTAGPGQMPGIGWGQHAFNSNGERIYFTATSERDSPIDYTGGPDQVDWMAMHGRLACVSCHGVDGQGGRRGRSVTGMGMGMGMGQRPSPAPMDAKDIRWSTLSEEFSEVQFAVLLRDGREPDGKALSQDMPHWRMADADVADLVAYLKTLP